MKHLLQFRYAYDFNIIKDEILIIISTDHHNRTVPESFDGNLGCSIIIVLNQLLLLTK